MSMSRRSIAALATCIVLLATVAAFPAEAQSPIQAPSGADSDATDVVVLLDVSQSVMPYFQDVTDFVISSVVKDYLRFGDTFHLLSFGEIAQTEIAQRMSSEADVKSVLGRLYLLYPLARYSDLVGGLSYLYQYVADLPESRRKVIVVITDGVHNPPPSSPTFGMPPEKVAAEIEAVAAKIRANGWPVHIIRLPFPKPGERGAPSPYSAEAKGKSYLDAAAAALDAKVSDFSADGKADIARNSLSLPMVQFPGPLGKRDYSFSFTIKLRNASESAVGLELDRVRLGDSDILASKAFLTLQGGRSGSMDVPVLIPDSVPQGRSKLQVTLHFANGVRVSPDSGTLDLDLAKNPISALLRSGARIVLFAIVLLLGLAALLGAAIMIRRMPKRAEPTIAAAVLQADAYDSATSSTAAAEVESPRARGVAAGAAPHPLKAADARAVLEAAAAAGSASEGERSASAIRSAKAIAASRREEAARDAALLAEAARRAAKVDPREAPAASVARGARALVRAVPESNEHDAVIEGSAAALLAQRKAESERTVSLLAEASGRRRPAARPSRSREAESKAQRQAASYAPRVVKPGSMEIELLVAEQNSHIGMRNVHALSAGASKSVGGGASDFLVFLVSVPRKSAELHFDGEKLAFVPIRSELFPELDGPMEDCLGKDIPMISRSGYPMTLRFVAYEKPANRINRLLHCIETPGL
jgi:hypothetical protein